VPLQAVVVPHEVGPHETVALAGDFFATEGPAPVVVFAHGSGSSRHSPRNRAVAERLQREGFATLLLDLLTAEEEAADRRTGHLRFDIGLLAGRLLSATGWLDRTAAYRPALGYFGASTGAAAALLAASQLGDRVGAIVSRGGRPDLAGAALPAVSAPTLLIVGELDRTVLDLNRQAARQLAGVHELAVVPGATHLFEEPGALAQVAELAANWFRKYLLAPASQ